ncbi:DUF6891 domain-containing protein [Undibacterium sp. Di27W]|uniref:DUF6891 domain-containing protein n=1 Tax=Undibacterium sp. Di27W TaxID=3413036 RepID=UPI003BF3FE05
MSADQITEITTLIREVFNHAQANSKSSADLCASFEVVGLSDAWAQVTLTELNVAYPLRHSPEQELHDIIQLLPKAELLSWEPMKYATWSFVSVAPAELAKVVDLIITRLFVLVDYSLNGEIFRLKMPTPEPSAEVQTEHDLSPSTSDMDNMNQNDNERYIAKAIHAWVWSGFYDANRVNEMLDDILEEDVDETDMRALINREFSEKRKQERKWPDTTDCDKLDAAFNELNSKLIIAIQNAGYTTSDGHEDVSEIHSKMPPGTYRGYCFYHGQDVERAVVGGGIFLAFGDMNNTEEGKLELAELIKTILQSHGLFVEWDGDINKRISIPRMIWQRKLRTS